jgi:prolyl-tRNA editing enzyme YbaK/EbsC (Cys-tRNA(Pro) deacylase)
MAAHSRTTADEIPGTVRDALTRGGLPIEACSLPRDAKTVRDVADAFGVEACRVLKSIVAREPGSDSAVVMLAAGTKPIDLGALGARLSCSLELVGAKEVKQLVGYSPGVVPPLGLRSGTRVVIHDSVPDAGRVFTGAGASGIVLAHDADELQRALRYPTESHRHIDKETK